jgi:hypothetical protein
VTDDLLDEATRLAANRNVFSPDDPAVRILRALVERVKQVEAERETYEREALNAAMNLHMGRAKRAEAERDAARDKLAAVKDAAETWADFAPADDWGEGGLADTVTADLGRYILRLVEG